MLKVISNFAGAVRFCAVIAAAMLAGACEPADEQSGQEEQSGPNSLIYVWMSDAAAEVPNFLAVIDADSTSGTYGTILKTIPTEGIRGDAHHTNVTLPKSGMLFANDFMGNGTHIFEMTDPENPVFRGSFGNIGDYSFAHSFAELPNGNILATYQTAGEGDDEAGGLVELTTAGEMVQAGSAYPGDPDLFVRPYGLLLLPHLDRAVTTSHDMKRGGIARHVQVWRLSDLTLLHTVPMPVEGRGDAEIEAFEPRLLADGKTVMFVTLSCGLYTLDGVDGDAPQINFAHDFGAEFCFLPVRGGKYWVQTVVDSFDEGVGEIIVLDVSNPNNPALVDQLDMAPGMVPHWLSPDQTGKRIVVTGYGAELENRVMLLNFDPESGKIWIDQAFGAGNAAGPGVMIDNMSRPQGDPGSASAHGAVFWPAADPSWAN